MRIRFAWGVATAAALTGCGGASGPSLSAFKTGYDAARVSATQLGADLGRAIQTAPQRTNSELATEFQQLSTRATREAAQLRRLDPPAKYRTQLGQVIGLRHGHKRPARDFGRGELRRRYERTEQHDQTPE